MLYEVRFKSREDKKIYRRYVNVFNIRPIDIAD
jgi:hypothetical protein